MAGSLAQPDVSRDNRFEYLILEVISQLQSDLMGKVVPAVKHGEQNPFNLQSGIKRLFDQMDRLEELAQPFHGIVLALQRDKHGMGRRQGIDGEQAERRGTINEDEIKVLPDPDERTPEPAFPIVHLDQLHLRPDQIDVGGKDREKGHIRGLNDPGGRDALHQHLVGAFPLILLAETESARRVRLWIGVDKKGAFFGSRNACGQVDRGRGLPHPTLLVRYRDDFAHSNDR